MKHLLFVLLVACSSPESPDAPAAAVQRVDVETIDEPAFQKLLQADDWSPMIDGRGVVSLTESRTDPDRHEITVHHFCPPRAAMWAKFEALDLAAELISQSSVLSRCHKLDASAEPTIAIDCVLDDGHVKSFRFARTGMLVGIATLAVGEIGPNDAKRFDAAIAAPPPCEP